MTNWLKWRLCALLGTSLLIGGASYLHAQSDYPAPAKTPEEAAASFYRLVDMAKNLNTRLPGSVEEGLQNPFVASNPKPLLGSISRAQIESFRLGDLRSGDLGESLYTLLSAAEKQQKRSPQFEARVTGTEGAQTIVEVAPSALAQPNNREVVVISEDGGYRVDLKATYARWTNLSGVKLDEEWFKYTGILSPTLAHNGDFVRSQCQSQMRQQMLGILQYVQDYDEKLPPARTWIDAVQPYIKSEEVFECPSLSKGKSGYAYNQYLSRFPVAKIDLVASTINIYETSNPRRNWFGTGTGRAYRHQEGQNLAFADGHIKWFKRGRTDSSLGITLNPRWNGD